MVASFAGRVTKNEGYAIIEALRVSIRTIADTFLQGRMFEVGCRVWTVITAANRQTFFIVN